MAARILVSLLDERQDYSRLQADDAKAAAARRSLSAEVLFAENNALVQIQQLFSRIHAPEAERPAAIVVHSATGEGLERVARNAVRSGIGWIILNRRVGYVDELRTSRADLPIARVSLDQSEIGRIQGRQVRKLVSAPGLLIYVSGPLDTSAAQDRLAGSEEELKRDGFQWQVLNGNRTEQGAETAVAGFLRLRTVGASQRPVVLVAQNDWMATGARRAGIAHDPAWESVPAIGCDGLPDHGQMLVRSGELAATVITPASSATAVELIADWLREQRIPPADVTLRSRSFPPEQELAQRA
jgi:ABC-type sugar transport system substrate-binding protein